MRGATHGHPLRRGVDQQGLGRPVRVDGHQPGRQPQRVRGRRRPRRAPPRLRLQRVRLRRPREAADARGRPAAPAHAVLHQQAGRRGPARLLPAPLRAVVDRAAVLQRLRAGAEDHRLLHLGDQPLRRPAPRRRAAGHRRPRRAVDGLRPRATTSRGPPCWRWSPSATTCRSTSAPGSTPAWRAGPDPHRGGRCRRAAAVQRPGGAGQPPRRGHPGAPGRRSASRRASPSGQGMADLVRGTQP